MRRDFFRDVALPSAARAVGGAAGPAELLVNGDFATTDNWTMGGTAPPSITGGKLQFPSGGSQNATQTLVGGSVPAGDYRVTIDIEANDDVVTVQLLGAGNEVRGGKGYDGVTGAGLTEVIAASGEVSKFRVTATADTTATVDNVSLVAE